MPPLIHDLKHEIISAGGVGGRGGASKKKGATTLHITEFLKPEISSWADDDPDNDDSTQLFCCLSISTSRKKIYVVVVLKYSQLAVPTLPTAPGGGSSTYSSNSGAPPSADISRLPSRPPFKAFVGNLAFNATAEDVGTFFYPTFAVRHCKRHSCCCYPSHCNLTRVGAWVHVWGTFPLALTLTTATQVTDVLILKHEDTGNVRGSFVEFETQDDLKGALGMNGQVRRIASARLTQVSSQSDVCHL